MRQGVQQQWRAVLARDAARAAVVSKTALDARTAKVAEVEARKLEQRRNAKVVGERAQVERRKRREESLATVRAQERSAREFAARVRHETRPEVRQETAHYFQAQRYAIVAEERDKQEQDKHTRRAQQTEYLARALGFISDVQQVEGLAAGARQRLTELRRQDAEAVRQQLQAERTRGECESRAFRAEVRQRHDATMAQRVDPLPLLGWAGTEDGESWSGERPEHGNDGRHPPASLQQEIRHELIAKSRGWSARQGR